MLKIRYTGSVVFLQKTVAGYKPDGLQNFQFDLTLEQIERGDLYGLLSEIGGGMDYWEAGFQRWLIGHDGTLTRLEDGVIE